MAQAPRQVNPSIAPLAAGALQPWWKSRPMFQYPDGAWNYGEGFVTGTGDADTGGWHGADDGRQVEPIDIHTWATWTQFLWDSNSGWSPNQYDVNSRIHPDMPQGMRRFAGYLRPGNLALPTTGHPFYGPIGTAFVDDAAFEVFAPITTQWNGTDPIVVTIGNFATMTFPGKHVVTGNPNFPDDYPSYDYRTIYPGSFSPDGLLRREQQNEAQGFVSNVDPHTVGRPQSVEIVGSWTAHPQPYYPIAAYIVPPTIHRPVELIMQRNLQLVQAIKLMLKSPSLTPLSAPLSDSEVDSKVVVVFLGGSNGSFQAMMGALLYPDLVNGAYGTVFGASLERVLGEQEMGLALSHLSGFADPGSSLGVIDFRNWGQFAWNRGFQLYDLSVPRRFHLNQTIRPFCLYAGDEDITTTGTDWILPLMGSSATTLPSPTSGITPGVSPTRRIAWASGEKATHNWRQITNPYDGQPIFWGFEKPLIADAIASKQQSPPPGVPTLASLGRQPGEEMRGIDDPHEWHFGQVAVPAAPWPNPPLFYDTNFFKAVQPGAAGTWLGNKESLLIANQKVYVGSTEGIVSRFYVGWGEAREPLIRDAQSPQLGHEAWSLLALPSGDIVVGTRRHLHLLHADLTPAGPVVQLPFEEAKPYRMHLAEVHLQNTGLEIVYASAYGGLVAYSQGLARLDEYSEPGVQDFLVSGTYNGSSVLTLLSERGVIANLALDLSPNAAQRAVLTAASPPQNGTPIDIEPAIICFPGYSTSLGTIALYANDDHKVSLRAFDPSSLFQASMLDDVTGPAAGSGHQYDLATVHWQTSTQPNQAGDHLLVLINDTLVLYDQFGVRIGWKSLFAAPASPPAGRLESYTLGLHACAVAVGELGGGPTGTYTEEIVVATETGHLMWMHVAELLGTSPSTLPSNYWMYDVNSGPGSNVQPRTNQALSCAWGIAADPNDAQHLHLLDQDGNHWQVGHTGTLELRNASSFMQVFSTQETRGAKYLGVTAHSLAFQNNELRWLFPLVPGGGRLTARAYCPKDTVGVILEQTSGLFLPNNWSQRDVNLVVFDGFAIFTRAGDVLVNGNNRDCFWWSDPPSVDTGGNPVGGWANMVQGVHLIASTNPTAVTADGVWASTANLAQTGGKHAYLDLRNIANFVPSCDQQSIRVVEHPTTGQKYGAPDLPVGDAAA